MEIILTSTTRQIIEEKISSGLYSNTDDVVDLALKLLKSLSPEEEQKLAKLRSDVRDGVQSGSSLPLDFSALRSHISA